MIQMQVVYLGVIPENTGRGVGKGHKWRRKSVYMVLSGECPPWTAGTGELWETSRRQSSGYQRPLAKSCRYGR